MKKCCENCRHWEPHYDLGYDPEKHMGSGDCRRYPPQLIWVPELSEDWPQAMNPETGVLHRCGEFKAMKNPRRPR